MQELVTADALTQPVEIATQTVPGSWRLKRDAHERYARARALLLPKLDAYCQAFGLDRQTMTAAELHAARGNASRLERGRGCPGMAARIAYLMQGDEENLAEKRKRLEEFLWLIHEHDPAELWEVAERIKTDDEGEPIIDEATGEPVKVSYQRARFLQDLPDDVRRIVQGVKITDSGKVVTEAYSKMQANQELRKLLGIGTSNGMLRDDVGDMTTTQIVAELNALGVEVKIGVSVTTEG